MDAPNKVWAGDITYVWTGKRWGYLAVVLDLFARKPVGWAMSLSPDSELVKKALSMVYESRGEPEGVISILTRDASIRACRSDSSCGITK